MDALRQRNKTILITALVTMVVTSMAWLCIGAVGYWLMVRQDPDFGLTAEHPGTVAVGEVFKMKVSVANEGTADMELEDLDVYDELLDGFEIVTVTPKPRSTMGILGMRTHSFSKALVPGEVFEIEFELRARQAGLWGGDIDACTPTQAFVTHYTEIEVIDPPDVGNAE